MTDFKDCIIDVETRIAYQENTIQELSSVVFEQQKQIDRLNEAVEFLARRLQDISDRSGEAVIDEPPPHY